MPHYEIGERVRFRNSTIMYGKVLDWIGNEEKNVYLIEWDDGRDDNPVRWEEERHLEKAT